MDDVLIPLIVAPILITTYIVAPVITGLKGRNDLVAFGVLLHPIWWVGAFLLAKPNSWWARKFYDAEKLALAQRRFPPRVAPVPYWQANRPDQQP
jgi:hypothetical protein